jgi:hypothetical protein
MKKPPKPSHCDGLARQQLDEDLSRRLDIVPGEVQESFQPIRSQVADPKPVPARVADLRQDLSKCNGRYNALCHLARNADVPSAMSGRKDFAGPVLHPPADSAVQRSAVQCPGPPTSRQRPLAEAGSAPAIPALEPGL